MSYLFKKKAPGVFEKEVEIKSNKVLCNILIEPDLDCKEADDFGPVGINCFDEDGKQTLSMSITDDEEYWPEEGFDENVLKKAAKIEISIMSNYYAEKIDNKEISSIGLTLIVNDCKICDKTGGNDIVSIMVYYD